MAKLRVTPSPFVSVSKNELVIDQRLRIEPTLEVDLKEVSIHSVPAEILRVKAVDDNGKYTYFWVSIGLNRQGRPVVGVSTENNGKTTRKKLVGTINRK